MRKLYSTLSSLTLLTLSTSTFADVYVHVNRPFHHRDIVIENAASDREIIVATNNPIPVTNGTVIINTNNAQPYMPKGLEWVDVKVGGHMPLNAVIGGGQLHPKTPLYICRAPYKSGVHPGKVFEGRCHISWGGEEITLSSRYQVLTSSVPLRWVAASNGYTPLNAVPGGFEEGHPIYICHGLYENGIHPGKVVGQACNIPWGGQEIVLNNYEVLSR